LVLRHTRSPGLQLGVHMLHTFACIKFSPLLIESELRETSIKEGKRFDYAFIMWPIT
jgi:hypothetical protein